SEDRLYTLSPIAWATVIVDSTVQARPAFAPLSSHCPLVQRGQTLPRVVRCTSEVRFTCSVVSPVSGSIVPVGSPFQRWTMQTGKLAAARGSGGPNASALRDPRPVRASRSQGGLPVGPRDLTQAWTAAIGAAGKGKR